MTFLGIAIMGSVGTEDGGEDPGSEDDEFDVPAETSNPAENANLSALKKVNDRQLSNWVGDIHEFKTEIVGNNMVSRYNVYLDKSSGYLFLQTRGGDPIPTYFNTNSDYGE